jgi:hypothetical protein
MTLAEFSALPFQDQVVAVWEYGTYIATRYEEEDTVGLYHMGGFFVELYYDNLANKLCEHLTTFTGDDTDRLEDYACYVKLDELKHL